MGREIDLYFYSNRIKTHGILDLGYPLPSFKSSRTRGGEETKRQPVGKGGLDSDARSASKIGR